MTLEHAERQALRFAVSDAHRRRLALTAATTPGARCAGVAVTGRPCTNLAGPDGLCGVHRRYKA